MCRFLPIPTETIDLGGISGATSLPSKPKGLTFGFDVTRWFDSGFGVRTAVDFEDGFFSRPSYYNDLLTQRECVTGSACHGELGDEAQRSTTASS
jgi:hypothetical protein